MDHIIDRHALQGIGVCHGRHVAERPASSQNTLKNCLLPVCHGCRGTRHVLAALTWWLAFATIATCIITSQIHVNVFTKHAVTQAIYS